MKAAVKKEGVLIPRRLLKGVKQVEIRKQGARIIVLQVPASADPILELGSNPGHSGHRDLSAQHDKYLYEDDK